MTTTTTTTTKARITFLNTDGWDTADQINDFVEMATEQGMRLRVADRLLDSRFGLTVAKAYGTGSVSIRTRAASGSGTYNVWVRPGESVTFSIG